MSFDALAEGARCDVCPLAKNGRPPVGMVPPQPPESGKLRLIIVGEGPGRREEHLLKPFVGQSGQLLDKLFDEAGGRDVREDSFITNSSLCRGDSDQEKDEAAACCAPRLYRELAALDPKIPILTLGKPAARSVLGIATVMKARGFIWTSREISPGAIKNAWRALEKEKDREKKVVLKLRAQALEGRALISGRTVLPSIHPAFVLRAETWRPVLAVDLDRCVRLLRNGGSLPLADQAGKYVVVSAVADVKRHLSKLRSVIAFDIETDGIDPIEAKIRCVGMSDGKHTVVIGPWVKSKHSKLVTECFKTRKVVGHNSFNFDEIAMKRDGVKFPKDHHDTLLAHHVFASHLPQGLSQVVSFYLDSSPWKITFKGTGGAKGNEKGISPDKLPTSELYRYNAADCRLSIGIWHAMQADLKPEQSVYDHDRRNGELCQKIRIAGIAIDLERRDYLANALRRRARRLLRRMRLLTKKKSFNPYRVADLRYALFTQFEAPRLQVTKTGLPSTNVTALQHLAAQQTRYGRLSRLILKYRGAQGTLRRNIEGVFISKDGRVHADWKAFGTMNGRWSCKLQQIPRAANPKKPILEDRIRELYVPRKGYIFVYFDLSQAEMRLAAQLSGDENFIKVCEGSDVHSGNALLIFPEAAEFIKNDPKGLGKDFRDIAKETGFAVNYLAGAETLFLRLQGKKLKKPVTKRTVDHMLAMIHRRFAGHFKYIEANIEMVKQQGYMRSPFIGRIRWFGWQAPTPAEIANGPVQQGVADIVNERLQEIDQAMPRDCQLVGQFHDAGLFECKIGKAAEQMEALIRQTFDEPVTLPGNGRSFILPIDLKTGMRLSEVT